LPHPSSRNVSGIRSIVKPVTSPEKVRHYSRNCSRSNRGADLQNDRLSFKAPSRPPDRRRDPPSLIHAQSQNIRQEPSFQNHHHPEPPKAQLRPFLIAERNGGPQSRPPRKASSLYYHLGTADLFLAEVNLDSNSVDSVKKLAPELHGQHDFDESMALRDACLSHPRVLAEIKKFKLPQHLEVVCDPWPYGRDSKKNLPRYVQVSSGQSLDERLLMEEVLPICTSPPSRI
jgi:hypothetical protein